MVIKNFINGVLVSFLTVSVSSMTAMESVLGDIKDRTLKPMKGSVERPQLSPDVEAVKSQVNAVLRSFLGGIVQPQARAVGFKKREVRALDGVHKL